jgi:two-component system phosphate regulon sensor histidine kinase PhoR
LFFLDYILSIISNVSELLEIESKKNKISLELDKNYLKPIFVMADKERIQQVITNLVMNSIKYGVENGTTEMSIQDLNKEKFIISVTDNGLGISKEHLPRLFERFYRVDKSGNRKKGGSGLGLSIVKHVIEAHNEKIFVESNKNVGSEFSFTLEKVI